MKTYSNPILSILGAFLVLLSCACDPCDGDPGAIEIDRADSSFPDLYWQVTTSAMTPSGPISAISLITDPNATISMSTAEMVEIVLVAEDNQSGINELDIQGSFGYNCSNVGATIALDGIIPGNPVSYELAEGVCAFAEANYPVFIIDGPNLCTGTYPQLSNGGYQLNGSATNAVGLISGATLTITVTNATL